MSAREYTNYQKSVINHYYRNLDTISLQRLGELVSELYLADSGKKQERLWQRVEKAMIQLKVPPAIRDHILSRRDVKVLAKNLQQWQSGKMGRPA